MAKENVKKFYEAITQDEAWQQKLAELSQKYQGETMNEEKRTQMVNDDILPLAAQMGIPFTLEELKQYETDMKQTNGNSELSDDELEAVAGGGEYHNFCFFVGVDQDTDKRKLAYCVFVGIEPHMSM